MAKAQEIALEIKRDSDWKEKRNRPGRTVTWEKTGFAAQISGLHKVLSKKHLKNNDLLSLAILFFDIDRNK